MIRARWMYGLWGLLALGAQAQESRTALPAGAPTQLEVQAVQADGSGYVLQGVRDGRKRWIRVSGTGSVDVSEPCIEACTDAFVRNEGTLRVDDGRFLTPLDRAGSECRLGMLDAFGEVLWAGAETECFGLDEPVHVLRRLRLDGAGGLWAIQTTPRSIWRIGADGEFAAPDALPEGYFWYLVSSLQSDASSFALYDADERFGLARIDLEGVRWAVDLPEGVSWNNLETAQNDDAWLIGSAPGLPGAPRGLHLARVSADGVLRFERSLDELPAALLVYAKPLAGDRLLIAGLPSLGGALDLHLIASDGTHLWSRPHDASWQVERIIDSVDDAPEARAFAYVVKHPAPPDFQTGLQREIEYRAADGTLIRTVPAREGAATVSAVLADGSLVHVGRVDDDGIQAPSQLVQHFTPDGDMQTAVDLAVGPAAVAAPVSLAAAANGEAYVTATLEGEAKVQLLAYAADGTLRWRRDIEAAAQGLYRSGLDQITRRQGEMAVGGDRVCVNRFTGQYRSLWLTHLLGLSPLQCFDRDSGNPVFSSGAALAIAVNAAGEVDRLFSDTCEGCADVRIVRERRNAEGEVVEVVTLDTAGVGQPGRRWGERVDGVNFVATIGSQGRASLLVGDPEGPLSLVTQEGDASTQHQVSDDSPSGQLARMVDTGSGVLVLHSWHDGVHQLRAIDPAGQLRWSFSVEGGLGELYLGSVIENEVGAPFLFDADGSTVVVAAQVSEAGLLHTELTALDTQTGAIRWQRQSLALDPRETRDMRLDGERGVVILATERPGTMLVEALALDDGAQLGARRLDCTDAVACDPRMVQLDGDGGLHVLGSNDLVRIDVDALLQPAELGQSALGGTWYDPATTGQGLLLEFAPATGDVFGAQFTYTDEDEFGVRGLRWYTLGGRVESGQTRGVLDIYRNGGGRFDDGPVTAAEIVGQVEVSLQRCDELVLNYRVSDGALAGLDGSIAMRRLVPSAHDCVEGDDSVVPATPAQPDLSRGIDRRHAGAWYEPATSGQGIVFDIRPPSLEGADPGVILGGWFTYDVADAANDADAQHWFLLQGDLAQASGGSTELVIYRASGGRFDHRPTNNTHEVGSAGITFSGCGNAMLQYRFDNDALAGSFAGREGQIPLVRLLPCPE